MKYDVRVIIRYKDGIPDVHGQQIVNSLRSIGLHDGVIAAHSGKVIDLEIYHDWDRRVYSSPEQTVEKMCQDLLAHPAIERFTYQLTAHYIQPDGTLLKLPISIADRVVHE